MAPRVDDPHPIQFSHQDTLFLQREPGAKSQGQPAQEQTEKQHEEQIQEQRILDGVITGPSHQEKFVPHQH